MAASVKVDGARIERLRKTRVGMSRTDAALALGISTTALYLIERTTHRTRPSTLIKIAELLKEKPEKLARAPEGTR